MSIETLGKKAFYNHFRSMGYTVCQMTNKLIKKINDDLVLELLPNGYDTMVIINCNEMYIRYFDSKSVTATDFENKALSIYNATKGLLS